MGLENLSTAFNDISKNSMEPQKVTSANSPAKSKEADGDNFKYHSLFYQEDTLFRTKTQNLLSKNTEYDKLEHTFASQGQHDDIIKINKITQDESPMSPRLVSYINPNGPENSVLENQYVQRSDNSIDIRSSFVNGEDIGRNRQLGIDKFVLESLYRTDHRGAAEREQINLNRTDNDGNPLFVNTLRSGMGSFSQLDIKNHSNSFYGRQPFIVNEIGSVPGDTIQSLNNRDILPIRQALTDVSRLAQFYVSQAGLLFIAKENVTNILIGSSPSNNPFPRKEPDLEPFGGDLNLINKVVIPPIPNPIQGNTGFLNFTNQFRDLGPVNASVRKPLEIEYSKRPSLGLPFGFLGDDLEKINLPFGPQGAGEYALPPTQPTRFHGLGQGLKYKSTDKISRTGVLEGEQILAGEGLPDLPPLETDLSNPVQQGDFYVRIKDLRDGKFIYFRGFATGITENVTPTFSPTRYIGRSEQVHVYSHGERDITFNLRVLPANKTEFRAMYEKLERLTSLAYPEYKQEQALLLEGFAVEELDITDTSPEVAAMDEDELNNQEPTPEGDDFDFDSLQFDSKYTALEKFTIGDVDSEFRMLAPFCELYMGHIGTKSRGQFGYFKSITYTVNEQGDWDSKSALPRVFDISLGYQILHRKAPSINTKFYGARIG